MLFYKRFPGDFIAKTRHLTLAERGAYDSLLDHYYANDGHLPSEVSALLRIAGAVGPEECAAVERVAGEYFPVNGDGLRHNKRADEEITRAHEKSVAARRSAVARWANR